MAAPVGTCLTMCSAEEVAERRAGHCVAEAESGGVFVACYRRSAAGDAVDLCRVRPLPVLLHTTEHLLLTVARSRPLNETYAFISDRLRAVRKDGRVQQCAEPAYTRALLAMARYYACAGYAFCGLSQTLSHLLAADSVDTNPDEADESTAAASASGFDPALNDRHLRHCLADASETLRRSASVSGDKSSIHAPAQPIMDPMAACEATSYTLALSLAQPSELHAGLDAAVRLREALRREGGDAHIPAVLTWAERFACEWARGCSTHEDAQGGSCGHALRCLRLMSELGDAARRMCASSSHGGSDTPSLIALRCILHRYLPQLRLRLLRALNDAVPKTVTLPITFVSAVLQTMTCRPCGETAWFTAARICSQCRLGVFDGRSPSKDPAELTADTLIRWNAHREAASWLLVRPSKTARLTPSAATGSDPDLRLLVALLPAREDTWLRDCDAECLVGPAAHTAGVERLLSSAFAFVASVVEL